MRRWPVDAAILVEPFSVGAALGGEMSRLVVVGLGVALALAGCESEGGGEPRNVQAGDAGTSGGGGEGGGAGGAGGQGGGAGGQGGGGQGGGAGEGGGGEGGAGGQGGQGGQGGGAGGQGGVGGGGSGAGGSGGEGGAMCTPDCAGRECGDDGCGGRCGRCGAGEVCDGGTCVREECPGDTFDCRGECVDLLRDADNCGSCGHRCADEWPEELTAAGFTPASTGIRVTCEQAECAFTCGGGGVGLGDLGDDPRNCGACGNVCASDTVNGVGDYCLAGHCACDLDTQYNDGLGAVCGDRCVLSTGFANCELGGCCPTLAPGANRGEARAEFDSHQYTFVNPERQRVRIAVDFAAWASNRVELYRYTDDGRFDEVFSLIDEVDPATETAIDPGFYGLVVSHRRWNVRRGPEAYTVNLELGPPPVDLVAPGAVELDAANGRVAANVRIPRAGDWRVHLQPIEEGECEDPWGMGVRNELGEEVFVNIEDTHCWSIGAEILWHDRIEPGLYTFYVNGSPVAGRYRYTVEEVPR
jgi:hypothetical protein